MIKEFDVFKIVLNIYFIKNKRSVSFLSEVCINPE